jgi:hypothetical protein
MGSVGGIRRKVRGVLAKPPLLPLPRSRTEKGGLGSGHSGGRAPAALAAAAAGERSNTERGTRGSYPRAHLGPRRREEADWRRRSEGGGGARGGSAVVLREAADARLRCGAARGWCWPFIGAVGRFPGEISRRRPLHRLRQGWQRRPARSAVVRSGWDSSCRGSRPWQQQSAARGQAAVASVSMRRLGVVVARQGGSARFLPAARGPAGVRRR